MCEAHLGYTNGGNRGMFRQYRNFFLHSAICFASDANCDGDLIEKDKDNFIDKFHIAMREIQTQRLKSRLLLSGHLLRLSCGRIFTRFPTVSRRVKQRGTTEAGGEREREDSFASSRRETDKGKRFQRIPGPIPIGLLRRAQTISKDKDSRF